MSMHVPDHGEHGDLPRAVPVMLCSALRWVGYAGITLSVLACLYLLWGALEAGDTTRSLTVDDITRYLSNTHMAGEVLFWSAFIGCLALGILHFRSIMLTLTVVVLSIACGWLLPSLVQTMGITERSAGDIAGTIIRYLRLSSTVFAGASGLLLVFQITTHLIDSLIHGRQPVAPTIKPKQPVAAPPKEVLLGKCYQLPYCVDFIRAKCPIYLAQKACWRHMVGCLCEESIIVNALTGTIPRNATREDFEKAIPVNTRLSVGEKRSRCRRCIIYNQHQLHKYRVAAPVVITLTLAIMVQYSAPLHKLLLAALHRVDTVVSKLTFLPQAAGYDTLESLARTSEMASWLLTGVAGLMVLTWLLKFTETVIFKWKM